MNAVHGLRALTLLLALTALSCTWNRQLINDDQLGRKVTEGEAAGVIERGKTTSAQLVQHLGSPPTSVLVTRNGQRLFVYNFGQAKTEGLTLILINILKTNFAVDTALFFFNEEEKLVDYMVSVNSEDVPWQWWAFGG